MQAGLGLLSCCQRQHSCTHSSLGVFWALGRPFRMFWINKHRIRDNNDPYCTLVELLQSLSRRPSRGKSTVHHQPSKVESTRSCCRLRS